MTTYTGPVPPAPTGTSTDAVWQNWWAYQGVLRDIRFEAERIARVIVTDRQHLERMGAEAACAAATTRLAAAQVEVARVMMLPTPVARSTDEQLTQEFLHSLLKSGKTGPEAMDMARQSVAFFRLYFRTTP